MKLTDNEIRDCMDAADQSHCERDGNKELFIARAIEAAVLEKVTKVDVEPVKPAGPEDQAVYDAIAANYSKEQK